MVAFFFVIKQNKCTAVINFIIFSLEYPMCVWKNQMIKKTSFLNFFLRCEFPEVERRHNHTFI